ncbi:MAG TPA: ArsA-related P-loop ATPase, partial [Candidatus Binataceae bacterium]|nr:ArsA-related P-loop ATPase [Candidatus Binataceae bacterium]
RTLLMECDTRAPLAAAFNLKPSFEPVTAAANLSLMVLEGRHALDEYLRLVVPGRMILNAVLSSRLYQFFVQAAPGLSELMMMGKIYYEAETRGAETNHWDSIVVDAPASGQALSFLKMPDAARATFGESIVGKESANIARMLRDHERCAIVQAATADGLSVSETIETFGELEKIGLAPAAILFNRAVPAEFGPEDVTALEKHDTGPESRARLDHLAALANGELARAAKSREATARIRAGTKAAVIEIPECPGASGMQLIDALTSRLSMLCGENERVAADQI